MGIVRTLLATLGLLVAASPATAEPIKLRMAAIAPEGTAWARELHALARDVEQQTGGKVLMKWYLGGIAGDELTAVDRVHRGQLDGAGGALFCTRLSPSLWVVRLVALMGLRPGTTEMVLNRLRPTVDRELDGNGFVELGLADFGAEILFTRHPVRTMADLRNGHYWVWDLDLALKKQLPAMGIQTVPLPLENASQAFEAGRIDGFIGLPTAALAFQWASLARYYTELPVAVMPGCLVVSRRTFDQLTVEQQQAVRAASAKFFLRFSDLGEHQDQALLHGLFEHQGLQHVPPSPALVAEFKEAARQAHAAIGDLVPKALVEQVVAWLAADEPSKLAR
jgi:TRAP-type C4-dicarboxylate transport system substrate-binding protein